MERSGKNKAPVYRAVVDGRLTVTNLEQLTDYIANGVGRSRSYGCGLISVVPDPIRTNCDRNLQTSRAKRQKLMTLL